MVGIAWPTLSVPGISRSSTMRINRNSAVVGAKEPMPSVSKKFVTKPMADCSHVGAPRAHTTGRTHDLSFRAGTALFGSFGIEWNLAAATDLERKELASWVALYKEVRELLHTGQTVRAPQHDPSFAVHGVVAHDRSEALFALVQLTSPETSVPGAVRLPGLDAARRYHVRIQTPGELTGHLRGIAPPPWTADGVTLPGSALERAGLRAPALFPEQLLLLRVRAVI